MTKMCPKKKLDFRLLLLQEVKVLQSGSVVLLEVCYATIGRFPTFLLSFGQLCVCGYVQTGFNL